MTSETPSEVNRRERRAVALTALNHLLNVAVKPYEGDRHSQQDLSDCFKAVSLCIGEFESEANELERPAVPPPADETWQDIETAPKEGAVLAIRRGVWAIPMILIWLDGPGLGEPAWRQFDGDSQRSFTPTHWMPLPSAPAKETP